VALAMYYHKKPKILVFLLVCASFNGMLFWYDKAVVVGAAIGLVLQNVQEAKPLKRQLKKLE
jgi:hypothetical protein